MGISRSVAAVVVAFALMVAGVVLAPAASANHDGCGGAHDEAMLRAQNYGPCRMTFIIDPLAGNFVSRGQLVANAGMYDQLGYDRNFLYWAGERVVSGRGHQWTHCNDNGTDNSCANNTWSPGPVSNTFADGVEPDLTVFGDASAFIARVCGNSKWGVRVNDRYHPTLAGEKFHDRNRDGIRQGDEGPLAGWTFRIEQLQADFGPTLGEVGHATTGADGRWVFDLVHASPGRYRVTEIAQPGWAVTTAASFEVHVGAGAENTRFDVAHWGNTPTTADVAKTEFRLLDPPSRIDADTPTELTVRVGLLNSGPAENVDVVDTVTPSSANPDCSFEPSEVVLNRRLAIGVPDTSDVTFTVTCADPSDHEVTFDDELRLAMAGFTDPVPANNTVGFTQGVEVWDSSDLEVTGAELECPARTDIEVAVTCTATAEVTNLGPYGPTLTDADLLLTTPADCTAEVVPGTEPAEDTVAVGGSRTVTQSWTVECAQRSFHPMRAAVTSRVPHVHVEDRAPANDTAVADDVVEVFESADLGVVIQDLVCTEREANTDSSACTATVDVTNHGPATAVSSLATTLATPADDCVVTPAAPVDEGFVLAQGETRVLTRDYQLACSEPVRHDVVVDASVRTDEPHAEDRNPDNDRDRLVWLPLDVKPRSLPSSVHVAKKGLVPVALLSTARTDTVAEVDVDSVRFGVLGTEGSVARCASGGEDVNDDGRADLVCQADTLLAGVTCDTTELVARGRLRDGTRFVAQDAVKAVGCPKP